MWDQQRRDLLRQALGPGWTGELHPCQALGTLEVAELERLGSDETYARRIQDQAEEVRKLEATPLDQDASQPDVAYFSPEFGISQTLPQYSGGLGILAGDHLKAASDLSLPLVAVGLFYANGYFDQGISDNQQSVTYKTYQPEDLGLSDTGETVSVSTPTGEIYASVWLAHVGATRLFMLDTRVTENDARGRAVTDRLYGGDQAHRIDQEWMLGIGGLRALRSLGIQPRTVHLNEGHAGFLLLELIAERMSSGETLSQAEEHIRNQTLFTTHTPVPAGIDRFPTHALRPYIDQWSAGLRTVHTGTAEAIWQSANLPSETDGDLFNMAAFCLRHAGLSNGVSALHGIVSQELFGSLDQGQEITSVTNGVHARTWMADSAQELLSRHIGSDFPQAPDKQWAKAASIPDGEIHTLRTNLRTSMVDYLRASHGLDAFSPDVLTVGFARRFATYKRAALLLRERDALIELLNNDEHPVQFVFAGKAHPADVDGQAVFEEIARFGASSEANGRFSLIGGYDIEVASHLYSGCDVWLNNPVRPQEACGTSGEKSALNGGLNCSIRDGWWAEWCHDDNGWTIQTSPESDPEARDDAEAAGLMRLLKTQVIPSFYEDSHGPSDAWIQRIRFGWQYLGPKVTAARMVSDYDSNLYQDLCERMKYA